MFKLIAKIVGSLILLILALEVCYGVYRGVYLLGDSDFLTFFDTIEGLTTKALAGALAWRTVSSPTLSDAMGALGGWLRGKTRSNRQTQ